MIECENSQISAHVYKQHGLQLLSVLLAPPAACHNEQGMCTTTTTGFQCERYTKEWRVAVVCLEEIVHEFLVLTFIGQTVFLQLAVKTRSGQANELGRHIPISLGVLQRLF